MSLNKKDLIGMGVLEAILAEKERQTKIYGEQNHDDSWWNLLLTQKHGKVTEEIFGYSDTKLFIEIVQTCATYLHGRKQ